MNKRKLVTIVGAQLMLLSSLAQANILIKLPNDGLCDKIPGAWSGNGAVSYGLIKCTYTGSATVTGTSSFNMHVILTRTSGICPATEDIQLAGTCGNGVLVVNSSDVNLTADVKEDATGLSAVVRPGGTISFDISPFGRITADVDSMTLKKK